MIALALALAAAEAGPDDPGLAAILAEHAPPKEETFTREEGPGFKLGLRRFVIPDQAASDTEALLGSMDFYPISSYVRFGLGASGGVGRPRNDILVQANGSLGVQWPARVTPFLDFAFGGGIYYRNMLVGQIFWLHTLGIDAGVEAYVAGDFYVSAALGWIRPVLHGAAAGQDLYFDAFTMKFGLGF